MEVVWVSPFLLTPPHVVTHPRRAMLLMQGYKLGGWGAWAPALVTYKNGNELQLLNGTHRRMGAMMAKMEKIPIVVHLKEEIEAARGDLVKWTAIMASGNRVV